jgi:glycosyltransferase XagB
MPPSRIVSSRRSDSSIQVVESPGVFPGSRRYACGVCAIIPLTRLFTAEYAGLFDVLLPSLATLRLPLPLGGSSNHFRAHILRKVRAWDPYNVTEDADLGMRLARAGYRTTVINSITYEEAPARVHAWLRQRTRWFKGWIQTWLVHMRTPHKTFRQLGPAGFTVFQLLVGGSVLAALVHPIFLVALVVDLATAAPGTTVVHYAPYLVVLCIGYVASLQLAIMGLARRKLMRCAWALLLIPLYWLLLSLAAWRALEQFLRDPYRWEKTEHGLARNSRLMDVAGAAPIKIKNSDAARRPPPRDGA